MGKTTKRYSDAFKEAAVAKVVAGASYNEVSRECGASSKSLRDWKTAADNAARGRPLTPSENEEMRALKRKIRRLEEDNEILKKATALYAAERR